MSTEKDVKESTWQVIIITCWYFNLKHPLTGSFLKAGWLVDELLGIKLGSEGSDILRGLMGSWILGTIGSW